MGHARMQTWLVAGLARVGGRVGGGERHTRGGTGPARPGGGPGGGRGGRQRALAIFNDRQGPFVDRDLYVFCMGREYKITAHVDVGMRGVDVATLKDPDGKQIGREMIEIAKRRGGGSLEYRWVNPVSKRGRGEDQLPEAGGRAGLRRRRLQMTVRATVFLFRDGVT